MLGVRRSACNLAVRGELGRYPLNSFILCNVLLYQNRLKKGTKNSILQAAFQTQDKMSIGYQNVVKVISNKIPHNHNTNSMLQLENKYSEMNAPVHPSGIIL